MSDDKQMAELKFTIPDAPPEKQIEMIESMMSVVKTMGKLTGEEVDLTAFHEAITKIKNGETENV